ERGALPRVVERLGQPRRGVDGQGGQGGRHRQLREVREDEPGKHRREGNAAVAPRERAGNRQRKVIRRGASARTATPRTSRDPTSTPAPTAAPCSPPGPRPRPPRGSRDTLPRRRPSDSSSSG